MGSEKVEGSLSQSEIPVHKRKELEYVQVKTRTTILLWE